MLGFSFLRNYFYGFSISWPIIISKMYVRLSAYYHWHFILPNGFIFISMFYVQINISTLCDLSGSRGTALLDQAHQFYIWLKKREPALNTPFYSIIFIYISIANMIAPWNRKLYEDLSFGKLKAYLNRVVSAYFDRNSVFEIRFISLKCWICLSELNANRLISLGGADQRWNSSFR